MPKYLYPFLVLALFPLNGHADNETIFEKTYGSGIKLLVKTKKFVPEEHQLKKCGDYFCLIDGKPAFGSDGKIPSVAVSQLIFEKDGKRVPLDTSSMYDPHINQQNIEKKLRVEPYWGEFHKVTGYFSDGAGTYVCQWVVSNAGGIRIHISDVESLFDLASKMQDDL